MIHKDVEDLRARPRLDVAALKPGDVVQTIGSRGPESIYLITSNATYVVLRPSTGFTGQLCNLELLKTLDAAVGLKKINLKLTITGDA